MESKFHELDSFEQILTGEVAPNFNDDFFLDANYESKVHIKNRYPNIESNFGSTKQIDTNGTFFSDTKYRPIRDQANYIN